MAAGGGGGALALRQQHAMIGSRPVTNAGGHWNVRAAVHSPSRRRRPFPAYCTPSLVRVVRPLCASCFAVCGGGGAMTGLQAERRPPGWEDAAGRRRANLDVARQRHTPGGGGSGDRAREGIGRGRGGGGRWGYQGLEGPLGMLGAGGWGRAGDVTQVRYCGVRGSGVVRLRPGFCGWAGCGIVQVDGGE